MIDILQAGIVDDPADIRLDRLALFAAWGASYNLARYTKKASETGAGWKFSKARRTILIGVVAGVVVSTTDGEMTSEAFELALFAAVPIANELWTAGENFFAQLFKYDVLSGHADEELELRDQSQQQQQQQQQTVTRREMMGLSKPESESKPSHPAKAAGETLRRSDSSSSSAPVEAPRDEPTPTHTQREDPEPTPTHTREPRRERAPRREREPQRERAPRREHRPTEYEIDPEA